MKHLGGGDERVDGEQTEARRAVDEDVVEVGLAQVVGQRPSEPHLPRHHGDQLDLRTGQVDRRRRAEQSLDRRTGHDDLGEGLPVDEHVVDARHLGVVVHAQGGAGVPLRVQVDDQHLQPGLGQGRGDVDRGRRLADATLLVRHGQHPRRGRGGELAPGQREASAGVLSEALGQGRVVAGLGDAGGELLAHLRGGRLRRNRVGPAVSRETSNSSAAAGPLVSRETARPPQPPARLFHVKQAHRPGPPLPRPRRCRASRARARSDHRRAAAANREPQRRPGVSRRSGSSSTSPSLTCRPRPPLRPSSPADGPPRPVLTPHPTTLAGPAPAPQHRAVDDRGQAGPGDGGRASARPRARLARARRA